MTRKMLQGAIVGLAAAGAVALAQELPEMVPPPDVEPSVAIAPAPTQDPARVRPQVRDEELTPEQRAQVSAIEQRLPKDAALEPAQRDEVRNELRAFARTQGNDKVARDTVQTAVKNGCRGQCLADALKALNRAREQGVPDKEAARLVTDGVTAQKRERARAKEQLTPQQEGERLQARIDARLAERAAKQAAKEARKAERGTGGSGGANEAKPPKAPKR